MTLHLPPPPIARCWSLRSLDAPFQKPRGWLAWALFGLSLAPFAVLTAALLSSATHWDDVGGRGTVDAVAGIVQLDLPTYASLFTVTAILAPALEEYVFRGFLLASLTRFMPTWAAVIASSAAFGLCHLSPRDLPQLVRVRVRGANRTCRALLPSHKGAVGFRLDSACAPML